MARKKKAVPFVGKETEEEERKEHHAIKRAGGDVATAMRKIAKRRKSRQHRR